MMGTLFWVLYLAIIGNTPKVFYVAEVSWLASYLLFLSLQIVRTEKMTAKFSWLATVCALYIAAIILAFHIFGPSYLVSSLFAITAGTIVYLAVFRLQNKTAFRKTDAVMLVCVVLQVLLYVVSGFTKDYTRFGLYYAVDILLTASFVALLPLTIRKVTAK